MSKRIRMYTLEDVASHSNASSCWISRAGKVYDVSGFLNDHPGGDDLILNHTGKDVEDAMRDEDEHVHSESAYEMLEEYLIGRIGAEESIVREGPSYSTGCSNDFRKADFTTRLGSYG